MKLVIAEKPSVAQSLAKVIGADKRQDGYLEGGGYLVSWCVGHLVELSAPERYDERFAKWRLEDLPILPERFLYEVSPETRKQYRILKSLMERSDVESLVCATDAGREVEVRTGGLTQEALSEELNISTDQLRKIECGSRGPSLDLWISLAVYFDVSTDYLLMGRDYVNLHSRKRLEGVLQELSGIIADLQDV